MVKAANLPEIYARRYEKYKIRGVKGVVKKMDAEIRKFKNNTRRI